MTIDRKRLRELATATAARGYCSITSSDLLALLDALEAQERPAAAEPPGCPTPGACSCPSAPAPADRHEWFKRSERDVFECCRLCGIVRNPNGGNRPCRGRVRVELREHAPAPADGPDIAPVHSLVERYRHKKTAGIYTIVADNALIESCLERVTIYQGEDGQMWLRPYEQFHDGRFERIPDAALAARTAPVCKHMNAERDALAERVDKLHKALAFINSNDCYSLTLAKAQATLALRNPSAPKDAG